MEKHEIGILNRNLQGSIFGKRDSQLLYDMHYIFVGPYEYKAMERVRYSAVGRLLRLYHKEELHIIEDYISCLCKASMDELSGDSHEKAASDLLKTLLSYARSQFHVAPNGNKSDNTIRAERDLLWIEQHYIDGMEINHILQDNETYFCGYDDSIKRRILYREIERGKSRLAAVACGLMFSAIWSREPEKRRIEIMEASQKCNPKLSLIY